MSKTNPVMLNGVSVGADGAELRDGDEVVFPSAEAERIVFRYALVLKETGAVLGVVKSIGSPISKNEVPKSPLGERNGARMAAKAATPAKEPTPAKTATPAKAATPAKTATPEKTATPAKAATPAKEPTPAKAATPAKTATPLKEPTPAKAATPAKTAKSPKSAKKSPAMTPHTRASRALVTNAVEALVEAENDAAAGNQASFAKAATPAKSPKSANKLTPHTRVARALVAEAVDTLVAEEAASMEVSFVEEAPVVASPAAKSPKSTSKSPRSAKKAASASPAAPLGFALSPIFVQEASASPAKASSASPMRSPRPSLKPMEARIGAPLVPGSAAKRKSLGIRFASDDAMEQVRFIPPHNGEPEVCGRIAPNQHLHSEEKRRRTPSRQYSEAISEGVEEDEELDDAIVNRIGCVGHTGPIPKFTAKAPEHAEQTGEETKKSPAKSPSRSGSRTRSLASPQSTGKSKRTAVSFAIGQCEVTDDVAGTPVERKSTSGLKRKGTPHAPPSRVEEDEDDEAGCEEEPLEIVTEGGFEEIMMRGEDTMDEDDGVRGVDVTIVEEGVLGSGRTDGAPYSIAGTEMDETDLDVSGSGEAGGDTADDIPVFRLGDVGNTGPIPHYSPACKASPLSTIKSAVKASPFVASPTGTDATGASPAMTSGGRSVRGTRSTRSRASSQGTGVRAPQNTPAAGMECNAQATACALMTGLEQYAGIAQTPGGHAKQGAVARILALEALEAEEAEELCTGASPAPTMLDVDETREDIVSGASPFVARAEHAAAIEAAEAAAEAGAAAAREAAREEEEQDAPAFDFDEAFAVDAALVAEGVADVEAAVEIELALEAAHAVTPEKVQQWLEQNLAEAVVEAQAELAAAATPKSAARVSLAGVDHISPATVIVKSRRGNNGNKLHGGLSARVAQIHRCGAFPITTHRLCDCPYSYQKGLFPLP
jgi:hypothetical protein